ncbi:MAG: phosphoribosylaminoimidazolesuccinocarboxamide synthase [Desulfovibrionaceae bacterium]|nr:phosphoribosylaminoimidazolesuccinocarboxamide synthase [Desulfovibrionaceae bacterium]
MTSFPSKGRLLYEGKAKRIYATDNSDELLVEYKNSLTAFNALKKDTLEGKGELNNKISSCLFKYLADNGVENHWVRQVDDIHQVVRSMTIIPVEVIVRNIATGSLVKRLGVQDGLKLAFPLVEYCYKSDELGDPLIIHDHAVLFGWADDEQLNQIKAICLEVNRLLANLFDRLGIILVDFKLEFGLDSRGRLMLADEVSPDTCRFWDKETMAKLDKDRFRQDLGDVLGAYREIWARLQRHFGI